MEKIAVVILAYADYESLELALAAHVKHLPLTDLEGRRVKIYILQNGRGTYDCERTYEVANRYHNLYPKDIVVVDTIPQGIPYFSLSTLFKSKVFKQYRYIVKLDDVLPLTPTWFLDLCQCWQDSVEQYGNQLAYVTGLVNNNPFGFKQVLNVMDLWNEYLDRYAREHLVGMSQENSYAAYRILPKDRVSTGGGGTIWRYAYISRWLHEKTTLDPKAFIKKRSL